MPRDTTTELTRRRVGAGVVAGALGAGGIAHLAGDASAQADVTGEFTATGDEATLAAAPGAITIHATGEASVETAGTLDQIRVTLQAETDSVDIDDLAETSLFDGASGSYDLRGDLIADHRDLAAEDFLPDAGGEQTTDVRVRVVAAAIVDGSVSAEASAEDTVPVTVTHEGVVVAVGGSADVTIESA